MLIGFDNKMPLYVIGDSIQSKELVGLISRESDKVQVSSISHDAVTQLPAQSFCILGFMNISYRQKFLQRYRDRFQWPSWISDESADSVSCAFGQGCVLYPHSLVMQCVKLGDFNHIAPMSYVSHGSCTGSNVILAPGNLVGGSTLIGSDVYLGQGCRIRDKISICSNVFVTMGSVVHKTIQESGRYVHNRRIGHIDPASLVGDDLGEFF